MEVEGETENEWLHRDAFELIIWYHPVWIIQVSADGMNLDGRYLYEKQKPENGIAFWFITSIVERSVYFFNFSARNSCSFLMIFLVSRACLKLLISYLWYHSTTNNMLIIMNGINIIIIYYIIIIIII